MRTLLNILFFSSSFRFFLMIFYFFILELSSSSSASLLGVSAILYDYLLSLKGVLSTSPHVMMGISSGSGEGALLIEY